MNVGKEPQFDDSLDLLLAERYFRGELNRDEADAFERLLEVSPEACELLSKAVLLTMSVQATAPRVASDGVPAELPPSRQLNRLRSMWWVALSVATVLIVSGLLISQPDPQRTGQLAEAKADAQSVEFESAALTVWTSMQSEPELEVFEEEYNEGEQVLPIAEVPDWMFAAVEAAEAAEMVGMDDEDTL